MNITSPPPAVRLEEFIFHPDPFKSEAVPRGLPRATMLKFLTERIDAATALRPLRQTEKVVDFYDLQEICPHFQALLQQQQKPEPDIVLRQIVLDRTLALVGAPPERESARTLYNDLIGRSSTIAEFEDLVWLNDALATPQSAARLKERIDTRRAESQPSDYQGKVELHKLEEIENVKLSRSEKANAVKERILKMPDRAGRIGEEIKMYLTIEYGYLEFLQPWAARRLRRETWAEQPEQQVAFKEDARLRAELAETFYQMGNSLVGVPHLDPQNLPALRVRCLRAAEFFGRDPVLEDVRYIREHAGTQFDILSNE
jgi:hypothetical protein